MTCTITDQQTIVGFSSVFTYSPAQKNMRSCCVSGSYINLRAAVVLSGFLLKAVLTYEASKNWQKPFLHILVRFGLISSSIVKSFGTACLSRSS